MSADSSATLASRCSKNILNTHLSPMLEEMKDRAIELWEKENKLSASWKHYLKHSEEEARQLAQDSLAEVIKETRVYALPAAFKDLEIDKQTDAVCMVPVL